MSAISTMLWPTKARDGFVFRWLGNLPLRRKLTALNLVVAMVVTMMTGLLVVVSFSAWLGGVFERDLVAVTDITSRNVAGALASDDRASAQDLIASLHAKPDIVAAWLHQSNGEVFSSLAGSPSPEFSRDELLLGAKKPSRRYFIVLRDVKLAGRILGYLVVKGDYLKAGASLGWNLVAIGLAMAGFSVALAIFLANKLQDVVLGPVLHLAETAKEVATNNDYGIRAERKSSDELGDLTDAFNRMLGEIQRKDRELQVSRARYQQSLAAARDGIWEVDLATGGLVFSNSYQQLLGYSDTEMPRTADAYFAIVHPGDVPRMLAARCDYLAGRVPTYNVEVRVMHKDGSYRWILSRAAAVLDATGKAVRLAGTHTDITERRQAEAEMRSLHQQLVVASRRAGMAEVATSVLHNVGNVLNSVNVSVNVIAKIFQNSRTKDVARISSLLDRHSGDLGAYLTTDAKGQRIPGYLAQLGEQLERENANCLGELSGLRANVDHIKLIVSMQQSNAKSSGWQESLTPGDLFEQALAAVNATALERHRIRVVKRYENLSPMLFDKHQVLQILVNFINNAKHAMVNCPTEERTLTLSVQRDRTGGAERLCFAVADTGIGIAPEVAPKIFSQGFTTRVDGHGFGLHSGVIAARNMGGTVEFASDGLGRGATFSLLMPIETGGAKS